MISLQCDVHIHSTTDQVVVRDTVLTANQYHVKQSNQTESVYAVDKATFIEGRGQTWFINNRRPHKLKQRIRELDELIQQHNPVFSKWRSPTFLQLMLQNAAIVNIVFNKFGDISRLSFDKYLVGKLQEQPTDVYFSEKHIIIVSLESRITAVTFSKPLDFSKNSQLSQADPRLVEVDLPSPLGRRLARHLAVSEEEGTLVVWWCPDQQQVYPWTPKLKAEDRANLVVYSLEPHPKLIAFHRTEAQLLRVKLLPGNLVHYIGQTHSPDKPSESKLENTVLQVDNKKHIRRKLSRLLSLPSLVVCVADIPSSDLVILATNQGYLLTFDQVENKLCSEVEVGFVVSSLSVSPNGAVFMATGQRGQVQCFDVALQPVSLVGPADDPAGAVLDLGHHLVGPAAVSGGPWSPGGGEMAFSWWLVLVQGGPMMTVRVSSGVLAANHLAPTQIVGEYLKLGAYHEALMFLSQLSWIHTGEKVLMSLSLVLNRLLRLPFSPDQEALLQMCLAIFYAPKKPFPDHIREEFIDNMRDLSRRFFHHLIRHNQIIKGFELAVDLDDYDLFIDVHHAAAKLQHHDLVQAAMIKAKAAYNLSSSEPNSRTGSSPSLPHPFHLSAGGLMQPGQSVTYLKTTAAKKIHTNEFSVSGEDSDNSFRNESNISLPLANTANPFSIPSNLATHSSIHSNLATHSSIHSNLATHSSIHSNLATHRSINSNLATHGSIHSNLATHSSIHSNLATHSSIHSNLATHSSINSIQTTPSSLHSNTAPFTPFTTTTFYTPYTTTTSSYSVNTPASSYRTPMASYTPYTPSAINTASFHVDPSISRVEVGTVMADQQSQVKQGPGQRVKAEHDFSSDSLGPGFNGENQPRADEGPGQRFKVELQSQADPGPVQRFKVEPQSQSETLERRFKVEPLSQDESLDRRYKVEPHYQTETLERKFNIDHQPQADMGPGQRFRAEPQSQPKSFEPRLKVDPLSNAESFERRFKVEPLSRVESLERRFDQQASIKQDLESRINMENVLPAADNGLESRLMVEPTSPVDFSGQRFVHSTPINPFLPSWGRHLQPRVKPGTPSQDNLSRIGEHSDMGAAMGSSPGDTPLENIQQRASGALTSVHNQSKLGQYPTHSQTLARHVLSNQFQQQPTTFVPNLSPGVTGFSSRQDNYAPPSDLQRFGALSLGSRSGATIQDRETILSSIVQTRTISRHAPPPSYLAHTSINNAQNKEREQIKVIHFGVV